MDDWEDQSPEESDDNEWDEYPDEDVDDDFQDFSEKAPVLVKPVREIKVSVPPKHVEPCAICLDALHTDLVFCKYVCGRVLHGNCIAGQSRCPLCRSEQGFAKI